LHPKNSWWCRVAGQLISWEIVVVVPWCPSTISR
jgi:hypothetical protein